MRIGGICIAICAAAGCTRDFAVPADLDRRPPQLGHFAVSPQFAKAGDTLTLTFDADEELSAASATFAGADASCTVHALSVTCTVTAAAAMGEGEHAFDAKASDLAHNEATAAAAASAVLDFTAPVIAVSESPTPAIRGSQTAFVVDSNEPLGAAPVITAAYLSAQPLCTGAVPGTRFVCAGAGISPTAPVGAASFTASGTDRAGNPGSSVPGAINIQNPVLPPPQVTVGDPSPAAGTVHTVITFTLTANQPLTSCAASVAGQLARCPKAPTGASCACTFEIPLSLAEGNNIILGFGSNENGTGTGSAGVQVDKTPPRLETTKVTVTRNPIGQNDTVSGAAGAADDADPSGVDYPGRKVVRIDLWDSDTATAPLLSVIPAADGSFAEVELPHSDGLADATLSPPIVYMTAADAAGNENPVPLSIQSGADDRPTVNDALAEFVRRPAGQLDGLDGPPGALVSTVCPLRRVRVWEETAFDEFSLVAEGPAEADGSFAELPVGTLTDAPSDLYLSAVDKCGSDGAKVPVSIKAGADPVAVGSEMTINRRDLTARDGVEGGPGALATTSCWVTGVQVLDASSTVIAEGPANVDGSFDEVLIGSNSSSWAAPNVRAVDKCGRTSGEVVPAAGVDTGPLVDGSLITLVSSTVAGSGVSGGVGAVTSPVSVLVSAAVLDPYRVQLAAVTPAGDGSFSQAIGAVAPARAYVSARDKAGLTRTSAVRNVEAALDLAGRAPYREAPSPVSLYEVASLVNPRSVGPGWAVASASEAGAAREAMAAAEGDGAAVITSSGMVTQGPLADWRQVPLPSGRTGAPLAYDEVHGQLVTFGGDDGTDLAETWVYGANGWQRMQPAHSPPARHNAMLAWDGAYVILFGGRFGNSPGVLRGDTWAWNGSDWATGQPAHSPDPRDSACMATTPSGTLLFGGNTGTPSSPVLSSETWRWDRATLDWVHESTPAGLVGRTGCGLSGDGAGRMVLFGGNIGFSGGSSETWLYDLSAKAWSPLMTPTTPPPRSFAGLAFDGSRSKVVMVGGTVALTPVTWEFTGSDWQTSAPAVEPLRSGFGLAYDSALQRVALFGGFGGRSYHGSLQAWDGAAWSALSDAPSARRQHAAAWDAGRGRMVVYGGARTDNDLFDELWEFDGAAWQQKTPATRPLRGISRASMAYDAFRGRSVLFGGTLGLDFLLLDTNEWDGADWHGVKPLASPPRRMDAAMAFDPARGRMVLFGGLTISNSTATAFADTWEYDGANWTQVSTAHAPTARYGASLSFDAASTRMLLFGGYTLASGAAQLANDVWAYDGGDWTQQPDGPSGLTARGFTWFDPFLPGTLMTPFDSKTYAGIDAVAGSPPGRTDTSVVYDAAGRQALSFGGAGTTLGTNGDFPRFSDVWRFSGDFNKPPPGTIAGSRWAAQYFSFPIDAQASASSLGLRYVGGSGADLYLWNWDTRQWENLGPVASDPITASYTTAAQAYLRGGRVWLLAVAPAASTDSTPSSVATDYALVQAAYTLPP